MFRIKHRFFILFLIIVSFDAMIALIHCRYKSYYILLITYLGCYYDVFPLTEFSYFSEYLAERFSAWYPCGLLLVLEIRYWLSEIVKLVSVRVLSCESLSASVAQSCFPSGSILGSMEVEDAEKLNKICSFG